MWRPGRQQTVERTTSPRRSIALPLRPGMAPAQPSVSSSFPVHSLEPIRLFGNIVQVYAWACPIGNSCACQVAAYYAHGEGKIPDKHRVSRSPLNGHIAGRRRPLSYATSGTRELRGGPRPPAVNEPAVRPLARTLEATQDRKL